MGERHDHPGSERQLTEKQMELFRAMAYHHRAGEARNRMEHDAERHRHVIDAVEKIRARDLRYGTEAYLLVIEAVESVLRGLSEARHISGQELCEGIRKLAVARFGPMAKEVLNFWGVRTTEDFGVIVFNLVEAGLLLKTDDDRIDDFLEVYDFADAFEHYYLNP
jgi:uncharacterized repeat protein (TIGR04138 family)